MKYIKEQKQTRRNNASIQRNKGAMVCAQKYCYKNNEDTKRKEFIFYKIQHLKRSPAFCALVKLLTLLSLSFYSTMLFAQEEIEEIEENIEENNTYTPVFRSGHNLSFLLSGEYSHWNVLQGVSSERISPVSETRFASGFYIRYAYHINIISNFGFFMGTTAGVMLPTSNYGALKPGYGLAFPTILGGLSLNFGQKFRVFSGAEYGAVWFPEMTVLTDSGSSKALAPVPDMFVFFGGVDYFFRKNKAISFQAGYRKMKTTCLNDCTNTTYLNTLSIDNKSIYAQVGLTLQVGEIQL